ncbi:MAG: ABC transporter ATP-binding protein [Clostridiales bacterium]|nr:ABC transporter ATP-binding protein [Clostridiales bacterium]
MSLQENTAREVAVKFENITKTFGSVVANNNVSFDVYKGEILSLLGENGCGKTTLMNMLSGIYFPDKGNIYVYGQPVVIQSPKDAFAYKIGMVHQHFKLVEVFTALQNIALILEKGQKYDLKKIREGVNQICSKYGFNIDLDKKVYNMSVSEKQTLEIVKVLYRGTDILVLDEPTAVLTPQETKKLFAVIKNMREDGKSIIIITHKLNEVMEISDRVTILRKGEYIGTVLTTETNEKELTEMMVGKKVELKIDRPKTEFDRPILEIRDLLVKADDGSVAINGTSFYIRSGEILGVAGITGCGQKELCEAIAGIRDIEKGLITHDGESLIGLSPKEIIKKGVSMSFIPEDRLGMGLVPSMSITDNMMLKTYADGKGIFVDRKNARERAVALVKKLSIVTPSTETPVRRLSGGNVQKVLVGREIESNPNVIVTAYPVRGLDINSSYAIYDILNEQKKKGTGILFIGEDLDVMLALCDKIMVLCHGRNMGIVHASKTTKEELGLMMTGSLDLSEAKNKEYGKAKDSRLTDEQWLELEQKENSEEKGENDNG